MDSRFFVISDTVEASALHGVLFSKIYKKEKHPWKTKSF